MPWLNVERAGGLPSVLVLGHTLDFNVFPKSFYTWTYAAMILY